MWRIMYTYIKILKQNRIWLIDEKKTSKYFKAISYSFWLTAKTQMIYLFNLCNIQITRATGKHSH